MKECCELSSLAQLHQSSDMSESIFSSFFDYSELKHRVLNIPNSIEHEYAIASNTIIDKS